MTPRPLAVGEELPPLLTDAEMKRNASKPSKGSKAKGKAKGRFCDINTFADFSLACLDRAEIAVWLLLWRDSRDGTARTSQTDLARRAGVNDRSVRRAIVSLERKGLLTVVYRGGLHRGLSVYRVRPLGKAQ
jgi:hypothetical protein